ncbi:MAG: 3-phosphoshikimate 1-carboxyvinyltransferase, partial [Candidatus Omnitrophica bacterium]|nr:3-phosphoshikimate 1-carboxyvinyltransferase [Candidatus Omnitrophota bacterium]
MKSFPAAFRLEPKAPPNLVEISLPGSKSYTNRALLLAALADGESTLTNALFSDDTERMVECLNALGIRVEADRAGKVLKVRGQGVPTVSPSEPLYCGNAGTAIRFLAPFCAFGPGEVILTGNERMRQRPIRDLLDGIRQVGGEAVDLEGTGCPPIRVKGGGLSGGLCRIEGSRSSQYFSALLLSAARMEQGLTLAVEGELVSKPYIDMTLSILERFGVYAANSEYRRLHVPPGQEPKAIDYEVEGDASAASYFLAAAAVTGKTVRVGPLPEDTCQGDRGFVRVLAEMGCGWRQVGDRVELTGGTLRGVEADLNAMSDTAQTLAVVALFAEGPTTIRNIANTRIKETDRIAALHQELEKLGAVVEEFPDGLRIHPKKVYTPAGIETYDDHRMAMSFAVAGSRI